LYRTEANGCNLLHIAYSFTVAIVKEWAISRMGKVGMPWVLPSVKTSSKKKIIFIFFPLCCPFGIMGKRRVILQVFFYFKNAHSKVTLQKKTKKKKRKKKKEEVTLH
jgi:hypothetical protein